MQIRVRLGDPLWRDIGMRRLTLDLGAGPATVAGALGALGERYPAAGVHPRNGAVRDGMPLHIFVNQRKVRWDDVAAAELHDGDELALFQIIVGG